jgi:hypothetical protein
MVTLRLRLINQSKHDVDLKWLAGAESDIKGTLIGGSFITVNWVRVGAVHLIAGTKKYLVVRDNVKTCVCAVVSGGSLPPGQTLNLWAKFPAPPESVQRVSVVVPNFDPIDNVPISSD